MNGDDIHYGLRMKLEAELNNAIMGGYRCFDFRRRVRQGLDIHFTFEDYTRIHSQLFEDLGEPRHV